MALEVWGLTFFSCSISFPHLRKSLTQGSLCIVWVWLFVVGCHWPVLWKPQWYRGSGAPRSERRLEVLLGESLERHECGPSNPEVYVNCIKWGSCGVYLFAWPEWVTKINFPQEEETPPFPFPLPLIFTTGLCRCQSHPRSWDAQGLNPSLLELLTLCWWRATDNQGNINLWAGPLGSTTGANSVRDFSPLGCT